MASTAESAHAPSCRAYGWRFHHAALVESHRRQSTRAFLDAFRHSQMYEVFITERLQLAATGYDTRDTFEGKVVEREAATRRTKQIKQIVSVGAKGVSKGVAMLQRAGHSVKAGSPLGHLQCICWAPLTAPAGCQLAGIAIGRICIIYCKAMHSTVVVVVCTA